MRDPSPSPHGDPSRTLKARISKQSWQALKSAKKVLGHIFKHDDTSENDAILAGNRASVQAVSTLSPPAPSFTRPKTPVPAEIIPSSTSRPESPSPTPVGLFIPQLISIPTPEARQRLEERMNMTHRGNKGGLDPRIQSVNVFCYNGKTHIKGLAATFDNGADANLIGKGAIERLGVPWTRTENLPRDFQAFTTFRDVNGGKFTVLGYATITWMFEDVPGVLFPTPVFVGEDTSVFEILIGHSCISSIYNSLEDAKAQHENSVKGKLKRTRGHIGRLFQSDAHHTRA